MSTTTPKRLSNSALHGQMILVITRWLLVLAGLALILWNPEPLNELRFKILFLLMLAGGNFYLGTQVLRRQVISKWIVYGASLSDLVVISLIIASEGGYASSTFIFYYPAILAISVAFTSFGSALFAGGAATTYFIIALVSMPFNDESFQVLAIRIAMIIAVAVIGNMYRQMERKRQQNISASQESAVDIFFGQVAIIWARWFFIGAAAILILWTAKTTEELTMGVLLIVVLMGVNFFVHGRYQMEKPANQFLILLTTLVDLGLITAVVLFWGNRGLDNHFFIFYYPLFFAFALVFSPRVTGAYTVVALGGYAAAVILAEPRILGDSVMLEFFVMRVITMAAMSALGTYYYRVQRKQRQIAREKRDHEQRVTAPLGQMVPQSK